MAHTKAENLKDLAHELALLRALPGLVEKSPGIFYYKNTGFLHFHDKDGERWADVKVGKSWVRLEAPFSASKAAKLKFLKAACSAHERLAEGKKKS